MNTNGPRIAIAHFNHRMHAILLACEADAMRAPFRCAMLAVLALLAATFVVLRIGYETNDDIFLTMIASGKGFCTSPDEHLVFSNVLLGHVLKWLYQSLPSFPWYGSYLLLAHYASQVAILYCALTINREAMPGGELASPSNSARRSFRRRMAAYLVCFAMAEAVQLNNLQFTSTGFMSALAGFFLLWLEVNRRMSGLRRLSIIRLGAAVGFILLAGLIRLESLVMAVLVATPLLVYLLFAASRRALAVPAAAGGIACLLLLAAVKYNANYYAADPAWRHFYAFNELRCKFNDYGWTEYSPQTAQIFSSVGWSKNDHDIFARWYFDDPELYSQARLSAVLNAYPWKTARFTPAYLGKFADRVLRDRAVWAVLLVLPFLFIRMGASQNAKRAILASGAIAVLLIVFITVNNKVPPMRVYFTLMTFPLFATLLFPLPASALPLLSIPARGLRNRLRSWSRQPRWTRAVVTMLVIGLVMGSYKQIRRGAKIDRNRAIVQQYLVEMQKEPRNLYVCAEASFPFQFISPLDNLASWSDVSTVILLWMQRTPFTDDMKQRYQITSLPAALYQRDDVVLITSEQHNSLFKTFVKEHYGADMEFAVTHDAGERFIAGRFHQTTPRAETATRNTRNRKVHSH